jgi:hypothetical protein
MSRSCPLCLTPPRYPLGPAGVSLPGLFCYVILPEDLGCRDVTNREAIRSLYRRARREHLALRRLGFANLAELEKVGRDIANLPLPHIPHVASAAIRSQLLTAARHRLKAA